jgi:hypothetical protein
MPFHGREPRERPVEPDPRVRVERRAAFRGEIRQQLARLAEPAEVRERVAQVGGEADPGARVGCRVVGEVVEAFLVEASRLLGPVEREVGAAERHVDVRLRERRHGRRLGRVLEMLGRLGVASRTRRREADRRLRPRCRVVVAGVLRLLEHFPEDVFGRGEVVAETQAELRVGEPHLAILLTRRHRPGLEVLSRNPELPRERPDRLHRRSPLAGLDPRDVRVANAGTGQLAL